MAKGLKGVEVFSIGKWRASTGPVSVDSPMLDRMVENFKELNSVSGFGVPAKLGHSSAVGAPAYGWMSNLYREGDTLLADFSDMDSKLIDEIEKRRYNSVSVEIWPRIEHAGKVYKDVLGGIAMLGAEWPAVKGLKPLSASLFADAGSEKLELQKEPQVTLKFTQEEHDALVQAEVGKEKVKLSGEIAELTGKLEDSEKRAELAEAALRSFKDDNAKKEIERIVDGAIKDGKLLPKQKAELMAMAEAMTAAASQKFKVGDKEKTGLEMFEDHIKALPGRVAYGERLGSKGEKPTENGEKAADAVHARVQEFLAANPKSDYSEAYQAVLKADPDLRQRYAQEIE